MRNETGDRPWRQHWRTIALVATAVLLVVAVGSDVEAKKKKNDDNGPPPATGPTTADLENLILMLKDQITMVKDQLTTLQTTVDNLPTGGAGNGAIDPCTVPPVWDEHIDNSQANNRFVSALGGAAQCDKETGLTWETAPGNTDGDQDVDINDRQDYGFALGHCITKAVGGKKGWRLPSIPELATLVDTTQGPPTLPANHPFINIQGSQLDDFYWSATTLSENPTQAGLLRFHPGLVSSGEKTRLGFVWCVRGPMNADAY